MQGILQSKRIIPKTMPLYRHHSYKKGTVKLKPNISRSKYLSILDMGLCPIAPPKGFPSVYGARLAHRPLETFGHKYLVFS